MSREVIVSLHNAQLKRLVRLRDRRERLREGLYLIEGARELARAVAASVPIETVYSCPELHSPDARALPWAQLPVTELGRAAFEKVSGREGPDGVLGLARTLPRTLPEPPAQATVVVLDGLEKPGNVGALLRTADGAGAHATVLVGDGLDLGNPNLIRASQGSVFTHPTAALTAPEALGWLRGHGFTLLACTPQATRTYWDAPLAGRSALLLGTEHAGLSAFWREAADVEMSIPMRGAADSLNVATAGALVLYEALRQRTAASP
ncbi:RNA methyltransferase [Deinococcus irradiatisoli]|uniref:RNA methyltransferase n=1 Tax=Deinococcus irradiatisoli TaxID=2202254 RepID=A0A2Z3JHV4_9DEIO|nr:TrmH family RNA methyltransferase [Deinococcus irradiatisoli]AWN24602.1 RNA methyltransferase [Deinococcus irradiatisoli]